MKYDPLSDRMAVLLAMQDCRDNPAALAVCDMWLRMFPVENYVSFGDKSMSQERESV